MFYIIIERDVNIFKQSIFSEQHGMTEVRFPTSKLDYWKVRPLSVERGAGLRKMFFTTRNLLGDRNHAGHRARMTRLNTDTRTLTETYVLSTQGKGTKCEWPCTHSITHKQLNIKHKCTHTWLGSVTIEKGVKWVQGMLHCGEAFNTCLDTGKRSRPLTVSYSEVLADKQQMSACIVQSFFH